MSMWAVRVESDTGGMLLDVRVPGNALHDALVLALKVLEAAQHHPPSNGVLLRLIALPG